MLQINDDTFLKPLSCEDAQSIFDVLDNEREYMRTWLPFVDHTTEVSYTKNVVDKMVNSIDKQFCIMYREQFVGLIGFKDTDLVNQKTEIGYWLSQSAQRNGIMRQAVSKLSDMAFNELGINRIQIKVAVANERSRNIPEKNGFVFEGIERDGELLVNNMFTDIAVYSLLKKEFI